MIDYSCLKGKRVSFVTLGCKLNFAETSTLAELLISHGAVRSVKGERADICIVNTCTVTSIADSKCRQAIHRVIKENQGAIVAVTGCYAQLSPNSIESIDGVDIVVGAQNRGDLIDQICYHLNDTSEKQHGVSTEDSTSFFPSCSHGDRTRYFLKVQDGCNYFCTYCTIPMARGRSRNGSIASMVAQAQKVADEGGREIVITGVNIGDFGRTTGETFIDLIKELDQVGGIQRYRISSIEPNLLTDEIIDFCAHSRAFMPHFHIPLQSGSDEVLRLMHRHYDTALFRQRIEHIRNVMPNAFIGVDVMTGTRGETQEYFDRSYEFINSLDISQLHVFTYSERPGTKALQIPYIVSATDRHIRTQRLLQLSDKKVHDFYSRHIGKTAYVLPEHTPAARRKMHGFTDNYIRVEIENHPELAGAIVAVRLGQLNEKQDAICANLL